jgi:hypothetical protein
MMEPMMDVAVLALLILLVALPYSSVGNAGVSGYLGVMISPGFSRKLVGRTSTRSKCGGCMTRL